MPYPAGRQAFPVDAAATPFTVIVDSTGVGDHTNIALDLVARLIGAMTGASRRARAIRAP